MRMYVDLKSKFTGALIGSAVGDAIGAPVEGWSMEMVSSVYGEKTPWKMIYGRYTDDTEMMIGVAESLIEHKGFNGANMARRFIQNYDAKRGYGPGSKEALKRLREGEGWEAASENLFGGEGSYGNGAAMRIAPIGIVYYDNADTLREIAYKSSHITHSHELGKEGAALQAFSIALAVRGQQEGMVSALSEFVRNDVYKEKIRKIAILLDKEASKKEVIAELGNGEAAFNSVPPAIYSFLRFDKFEDSVVYAVSLGGDTDTIGAMTGAISGAYYGDGAIPTDWVERLEEGEKGKSYIKRLAEELYHLKEL
ncbi:MAG: ADP-ribosylglycohydrolase family protein [Methanophagales archaeon]|nr:ADP-ribosylglycohydrolase family protein [Methanophagales archaeon]